MTLPQAYLDLLRELERHSGRFPGDTVDQFWDNILLPDVARHEYDAKDIATWLEKQTYLAFGVGLLAAAALDIDVTAMEGFFPQLLDTELGLRSRGFTSIVLLALGRRSSDDHGLERPKPRLPVNEVFTILD